LYGGQLTGYDMVHLLPTNPAAVSQAIVNLAEVALGWPGPVMPPGRLTVGFRDRRTRSPRSRDLLLVAGSVVDCNL